MAKKSKEVKFTKKEINSLQQLRSDYANVELSLGKLEIARMQSEVSELTEKYGVGNLDINTGKFTPVS